MERARIEEILEQEGATALFLDGHDNAILGVVLTPEKKYCVAYDEDTIVENLIQGGMTLRDAWDYLEYNITGAYVGATGPAYLTLTVEL